MKKKTEGEKPTHVSVDKIEVEIRELVPIREVVGEHEAPIIVGNEFDVEKRDELRAHHPRPPDDIPQRKVSVQLGSHEVPQSPTSGIVE